VSRDAAHLAARCGDSEAQGLQQSGWQQTGMDSGNDFEA